MDKQVNIIGLTGPTGSGKSQAVRIVKSISSDIYIVDADRVSHNLLERNQNLKNDILSVFSDEILDDKKFTNRKKLGEVVFSDKQKLTSLNNIIFPYIRFEIINIINSCKDKYKIILLDAPTLIQSGLYKICDKIIVVTADHDIRLKRIIERDGLLFNKACNRIDSQLCDDEYLRKADFVINNDKGLLELKKNISVILEMILNNM